MLLYACSTNARKLREFSLLAHRNDAPGLQIEPLPKLELIAAPEENATTFEGNAVTKAVYYSDFTPQFVFADDSGIEVDALGGNPGVYSARYAGPGATDEANNQKLIDALASHSDRGARFVCALALARAGRLITTVRGSVEGEILHSPRGNNGFGYDPLFFYAPLNRAFGELDIVNKFLVSHRGNALRSLMAWLTAHPIS